jgi:hypothetical protein
VVVDSPFKDSRGSRGSKDKHEIKPETALRQLPEWGRTFQQRDRSPFPWGRTGDGVDWGHVAFSRSRKNFCIGRKGRGKEEGQVRRNRTSSRKGTHLPEKGQVDKASRTSNPTFVSISFRPGVRVTERRLFPVGPTEKEFLHREFWDSLRRLAVTVAPNHTKTESLGGVCVPVEGFTGELPKIDMVTRKAAKPSVL